MAGSAKLSDTLGTMMMRMNNSAVAGIAADSETGTDNMHLVADTERRRGLRIHQTRPIKVFEPTAARYFGGQTEDVSATGLRIELPRSVAISVGKLLSVHVGLNGLGESLANRKQMIPARVVWVHREFGADKPLLSAGLEFITSITAHQDAA